MSNSIINKEDKMIGKSISLKYDIVKKIGEGGMGSKVYLAKNNETDENNYFSKKYKYVAIKIIQKTNDMQNNQWIKTHDEGVTNARLNDSDYIVKLHEMDRANNDVTMLIMEYMSGPTLKEYIRKRGCLPIPEALSIFKSILFGVAAMHSKNRLIIHRDLKPENIMLSEDFLDVKISDFGVSSVVIEENNLKIKEVLTEESTFYGTVPYATPDIIFAKNEFGGFDASKISKQYDFHALGVIFYEMLVGQKPYEYENENDAKNIWMWLKFDTIPLKRINDSIRNEIDNIFFKLTASKQEHLNYRYNNVSEIIEDVEKVEKNILYSKEDEQLIFAHNKRNYQNSKCFVLEDNIKEKKWLDFFKSNRWVITIISLLFFLIILLVLFISFEFALW